MRSIWFLILLGSLITYFCFATVSGEVAHQSKDASKPTFDQCKGYVDEALKTSSPADDESQEGTQEETSAEEDPPDSGEDTTEVYQSDEDNQNDSKTENESQEDEDATTEANDDDRNSEETGEEQSEEEAVTEENTVEEDEADSNENDENATGEQNSGEATEEDTTQENNSADAAGTNEDATTEDDSTQATSTEDEDSAEGDGAEQTSAEEVTSQEDTTAEDEGATAEDTTDENTTQEDTTTEDATAEDTTEDATAEDTTTEDATAEDTSTEDATAENTTTEDATAEDTTTEDATAEDTTAEDTTQNASEEDEDTTAEDEPKSEEDDTSANADTTEDSGEEEESNRSVSGDVADQADQPQSDESQEDQATQEDQASTEDSGSPEAEDGVSAEGGQASEEQAGSEEVSEEEEEEVEPYEPRSRDHITQILGLDDSEQTKNTFSMLDKVTQTTLKELKSTYENAIKPLEHLYKYRDLSNRHFADPEIFSKPLIVFMGPWSGGKSTIINWLLGIQHEDNALRTGADPSPAQFNIMMYGNEPEKLDGTQLAADWTFSGLQKFGQSFLDRLRGQKLPNRLLEKVNIVEIPGILEVRKQVERSFPFNDACQWFIDRADTLFLVYDPAKLDIGPETEAILDQLKGRENQVRIVLNKADTVKPDELLRVQAMLVWNISPLMSSAEPPVLYAASLWDRPLQVESPKSLLVAHENNFLKDIRDGIERRVETRIAAARRFAVRVRNHGKMVDCYLNTYNNHRSFFSDKKKISTDIIDHPQNYHIYEGLSTLTNISRYDLPDPDTYRDFFRLNPLWDFPTLSSTCSFFRGCPLHKLDIAIAYDLPEILGKFRRQREAILTAKSQQQHSHNCE